MTRRTRRPDAPDEAALITAVKTGLKKMNEAALEIGAALKALRDGPKFGLTQEHWNTFLLSEFSMSRTTASKFIKLAAYEAPHLDDNSSIWNHMPPRWTSQYAIVSKLEPDQLKTAIEAGEVNPSMTGGQISKVVKRARGDIGGSGTDDEPLAVIRVARDHPLNIIFVAMSEQFFPIRDDDVPRIAGMLAGVLNSVHARHSGSCLPTRRKARRHKKAGTARGQRGPGTIYGTVASQIIARYHGK